MRRARGFTLLEVLVATVIMAVAVSGLMSALSTSMRSAARLTDYDRAAMLARQKMDDLLTMGRLPRRDILQGAWELTQSAGIQAGWRARVIPFEMPPNPGPGAAILDRIELEVWWMTPTAERRTFVLEGFRRSTLTQEDIAAGALLPQ
jgi:general secretion pathway protein I